MAGSVLQPRFAGQTKASTLDTTIGTMVEQFFVAAKDSVFSVEKLGLPVLSWQVTVFHQAAHFSVLTESVEYLKITSAA